MASDNWMNATAELLTYYEQEWGQPEHDDQRLFELLCLETYQAGLSWQTVLAKRAAFRTAFYQFEIQKVAQMTTTDIDRLLQNPAIIRNRRKLAATVNNAQVVFSNSTRTGKFCALSVGFC